MASAEGFDVALALPGAHLQARKTMEKDRGILERMFTHWR